MENSIKNSRTESIQSALEGESRKKIGDIIDTTANELCKYVNTVAGDVVLANADNEVKRILTDMITSYEERMKNAS